MRGRLHFNAAFTSMASKKTTSQKRPQTLIGRLDTMGRGALADEYLAIASNIESALRYAGAAPGKDYTHLDLFRLALPFVVEKFKAGSITEYDYPSEKVLG